MIQATLPIPFEAVDTLDEYLLEQGDSRWMVSQDIIARNASLLGVFESLTDAHQAWEALKADGSPFAEFDAPQFRDLPDEDWRNSYKAHFKAWKFGRLHWVPLWERESYTIPPGEVAIWLDPGLAFGTGNHETTRLCCERLAQLSERYSPSARIVDAGCGSGILALSAAKLGFRSVGGFDNDPEAVRVSEENAALNGLSSHVQFWVGDLKTGWKTGRGDIVLANIQADVLMRFASDLLGAVAPGGALVLSGILAEEITQVRSHFAQLAPEADLQSRQMGEWADLQLLLK